jgi:hypothetical protein
LSLAGQTAKEKKNRLVFQTKTFVNTRKFDFIFFFFSNLCQSADDDDDDSLSRLTRIQDSPIESNHAHSYMYVFIDSIIVYVCHPNLTTRERGLVTQFIHFLFNRWWWSVLYWEKKANGYVHEHEQFNFLISFFSHYMHTN